MCLIRLGGDEVGYFMLTVHGRNIPDSEDYWDGNWLSCTAEVNTWAFQGVVDGLLRNEDLARFLNQLEQLYTSLTGEAQLDILEDWLDLRLIGDGKGHIEARGELRDDPVHGSTLEFRLFFDQTFLPPVIRQVRAVLDRFPIVGQLPA